MNVCNEGLKMTFDDLAFYSTIAITTWSVLALSVSVLFGWMLYRVDR
jgi:hypothetical protein